MGKPNSSANHRQHASGGTRGYNSPPCITGEAQGRIVLNRSWLFFIYGPFGGGYIPRILSSKAAKAALAPSPMEIMICL
jgi:hypothetical protein